MSVKVQSTRASSTSVCPVKRIAIVGLPNTGKTQVFNNLTGEHAPVANYPLTTLELKRASYQNDGDLYEAIDTPGLHCLYIHSEEELVVRDMIFTERPDILIQCVDSNQLKQSLTLTADLLELGIPMIICLNVIDETARRGVWIDSGGLSRLLGVPTVESIAVTGQGTKELQRLLRRPRNRTSGLPYGQLVESAISALQSQLPADMHYKRKTAVLLLLDDPFLADSLRDKYGDDTAAEVRSQVNRIRRQFRGHFGPVINDRRSRWVDEIAEKTVRKQRIRLGEFSKTFARLSRHPLFGIPIMLAVVSVLFFLVATVATTVSAWMDRSLWLPLHGAIDRLVPSGFWNDFLIGDYGILSLGVANALLTILPILVVFFLAYNILEDIGYIPNLCVLTTRLLSKIGLSGNAIMPITLAFGCKTMATFTTRSLRSRKDRYICIYLIAFGIPCASQMALNVSILGRYGVTAVLVTVSVLIAAWLTTGAILNQIIREKMPRDVLYTLPDIRLPRLKAVIKKTYYKVLWFLKEGLPVFMLAAVVLFIADQTGLLGVIRGALAPVIEGALGLPLRMVDVLILSMARHEAGAGMLIRLVERGEVSYAQGIVAVTLTMMFVPCFANIVAMGKELGVRKALLMVLMINVTAFAVASGLSAVLRTFGAR